MLKNLNDYGNMGKWMIKTLKWAWLWAAILTIVLIELLSLIGAQSFTLINFSFLNESLARRQELYGILLQLYGGLTIIPYAVIFGIYIWLPRIEK